MLSSFSFSLYTANDVQTVDSLMQWLEVEARNRGKSHLESTHIGFVWKILSKELNCKKNKIKKSLQHFNETTVGFEMEHVFKLQCFSYFIFCFFF